MKPLLDECVTRYLKADFIGHGPAVQNVKARVNGVAS